VVGLAKGLGTGLGLTAGLEAELGLAAGLDVIAAAGLPRRAWIDRI